MTEKKKVCLHMNVARDPAQLEYTINNLIENAGIPREDYEIIFITWRTDPEVYEWLNKRGFKYSEAPYKEGMTYLQALYCGYNWGYERAYEISDTACGVMSDHFYFKGWLKNLLVHNRPNRMTNSLIIERGILPGIHRTLDCGPVLPGKFDEKKFLDYAEKLYKQYDGKVALSDKEYGRRVDSSPYLLPIDLWKTHGPMRDYLTNGSPDPAGVYVNGICGDTHLPNLIRHHGGECIKVMDSITYHSQRQTTTEDEKSGRGLK